MKKMLFLLLGAAAVSAFGETTTTLGTVGVTKIESKLTNTIVAVSYDDLTGGSGIIVSNFVKTTNLTKGDQLVTFTNGFYEAWTLASNETTHVQYWDKAQTTFNVGGDGKLVAKDGTSASIVTEAVGTGIWLVRQNPTDGEDNAIPFYIYGKPLSSPESQIERGKWNLVGNPKQVEVDLGTTKVTNAKEGDQIVAIEEGGVARYYVFKPGYGWQRNNKGTPVSLPAIGAGLGVWILTAENATISW